MYPTPEEERKILLGLLGMLALTVSGAIGFMLVFAVVLGKVSQWVFG